jgi:hypothetical protein
MREVSSAYVPNKQKKKLLYLIYCKKTCKLRLSFFIEPMSSSSTLKICKIEAPMGDAWYYTTFFQPSVKEVRPHETSSRNQRINASKLGHLRIWCELPSAVATMFCRLKPRYTLVRHSSQVRYPAAPILSSMHNSTPLRTRHSNGPEQASGLPRLLKTKPVDCGKLYCWAGKSV